ncbi:MAG: pyridoxamine kinase [Candidatus Methanomethylophilus sp.]|nr:pyridoxamine kinase [Methanomethylophilus sp.]MDD3233067.1 pyridoxamine kinase [Methanomethylophilus sp.]MDD4222522.1 pyridoxamine kinase [Methanomethylophilus sp.]MDD4668445.1 pyridoxamine kinase [Methanomethylophilus sp.]
MEQKRVLAIHDISCVGKCSLTVALPIISATGIECSVMPTAVLSTHTGGFVGYTYRDLTADLDPIVKHWETLKIRFNGIYTGFLGSFEQIDIVSGIFDRIGKHARIFVDPVMADNGELYKVFPDTFPQGMKKLCAKADLIMPNLTEATLLLGEPYKKGPYTKDYIEGVLKRLSALGPKQVVLTGVYLNEEDLGAASYDRDTGEINYAFHRIIPGYYHGTGDIFGSVIVGCLMNDVPLTRATEIAVDFTCRSIMRTWEARTDVRFGVNFEAGIPKLVQDIGLKPE